MRKEILTAVAVFITAAATAQTSMQDLLVKVEANNPQLQARRELTKAQTLEARVGNSLANPTVSYDHLWGSPSALGKSQEFNFTQSFDLPMVYIYKNNAARARAQQFGYEYAEFRQQLLLEAQVTYLQAVALQEQVVNSGNRLAQVQRVAQAVETRFNNGDASVIEKNRASIEVANNRNDLELLKVELRSSLSRLSTLCGGEEVDVTGVSIAKIAEGSEEIMEKSKMEEVYANTSPRLLTAISQVNAAKQDIKVSRGESLPKFELGYRRELASGEKFNGITMGMSIPMFGNRNNVKRAKAQHHYAEVSLQSDKLNVSTLLTELYDKLDILRTALQNYDKAGDTAGNSAIILDKALNNGLLSIQEYISEIDIVTTTRQTHISLLRDYLSVCAQIRSIEL